MLTRDTADLSFISQYRSLISTRGATVGRIARRVGRVPAVPIPVTKSLRERRTRARARARLCARVHVCVNALDEGRVGGLAGRKGKRRLPYSPRLCYVANDGAYLGICSLPFDRGVRWRAGGRSGAANGVSRDGVARETS